MAVHDAHWQSPIAKEMWQSTHPRKFGNHVTVHRASEQVGRLLYIMLCFPTKMLHLNAPFFPL